MLIVISIYYIVISILAFTSMYYDKKKSSQNTNGKGRIKEKTLLLYALLGGSIGSLLGMYKLRHKTKHTSFILTFWFSLVVHVLLIGYLIFKNYM